MPGDNVYVVNHAIDAYEIFYPESHGGGVLLHELDLGEPIQRDIALRFVGRDGSGPGAAESGYVLHRERTGIFVLVDQEHDRLPDPVDLHEDRSFKVVTFLRFYSLHQHQLAVHLFGKGDPVTAHVLWRPAVELADRSRSAKLAKSNQRKVKPPAPQSPPKMKISQGLANAFGGRPAVRAMLSTKKPVETGPGYEVYVVGGKQIRLEPMEEDGEKIVHVFLVPPRDSGAGPKLPPLSEDRLGSVRALRERVGDRSLSATGTQAAHIRISDPFFPMAKNEWSRRRWQIRAALVDAGAEAFTTTKNGHFFQIYVEGQIVEGWLVLMNGSEWWVLDRPGEDLDPEHIRLANVLKDAGWRVYPPVPGHAQAQDDGLVERGVEVVDWTDPKQVSRKILNWLDGDNDCVHEPTEEQRMALAGAVESMMAEGLVFNNEVALELAAGEESEREEKYGRYEGWKILDEMLAAIFDGPSKP